MPSNATTEKKVAEHELKLLFLSFLKKFTTFLNEKVHDAPSPERTKRKKKFLVFFLLTGFFFCETPILHAMYIKHKLSARSFALYYISNVFMLSFTPCLNFRILFIRVHSISLFPFFLFILYFDINRF